MDVYQTEDEQLEQAKRWLRENGATLVIAIVLALAAVLGWRYWNERQATRMATAAAQYESLLQAVEQWSATGNAAAATTAATLAEMLKQDFDNTGYADLAAMLRARLAVADARYNEAAVELRWVLERDPEEGLAAVARYRLARVLFTQEQGTEALALLESAPADNFQPVYQRLRGDILLTQGQEDAARAAYQEALELGTAAGTPTDPLLEMKLRDLQPPVRPTQES